MKKILSACILAIMFLTLALKVNAQGELNWFIKRKGRYIPIFPKEAVEAESYDAYYIDKSGEKKIYLTFDAGYENGNVEKILDVLK